RTSAMVKRRSLFNERLNTLPHDYLLHFSCRFITRILFLFPLCRKNIWSGSPKGNTGNDYGRWGRLCGTARVENISDSVPQYCWLGTYLWSDCRSHVGPGGLFMDCFWFIAWRGRT